MDKISADDWRSVFALLDTALELPVAARTAWLASLDGEPAHVTGKLRALLARQTADDFLHQLPQFTASPHLPTANALSETLDVGSTVGPYRLLGRLGRGGMSTVWIGERIDGMLKRRVAIKLPHVSWAVPEVAARMARERDLLSSLEHPNIARLYDAGVGDDGRPYLALELVDGLPIDEHCTARNADIALRVSLVRQTATAVAYAHSRSIVHRDLKPSNILVDSAGQVRLLDFGIGKLLEGDAVAGANDTQFGARLFTPDYASPEQLRGEPITAASDVFSLGVVLYQLLCGQLPFPSRVARDANGQRPADSVPRAPSAIRGDLDTVVRKALKDSVSERFSSMNAFAQDLERYLRGEPVLARPDSVGYRLRKFSSRNRRALGAVSAAIVLTASIGTGLAVHQAQRQITAAARANEVSADVIALRAVPATRPTTNADAYREYLQMRALMRWPTEDNLHKIIELAQSATERDAGFARGHSLLAGASVLLLELGYPHPEALAQAEPAVQRALTLDPVLASAHGTRASIAAHRGNWLAAEKHFGAAFKAADPTSTVRGRYARMVLAPTGHLREALRESHADFRVSPGHSLAAIQVASFSSLLGLDEDAHKYADAAISSGWPSASPWVENIYWRSALRAGRYADAADHQALALPVAVRRAGGVETVRLLNGAMADPALRTAAIAALDALRAEDQATGMDSFAMLMFSIHWYARLEDLDRAYGASNRWLGQSAKLGLAGTPYMAGFWIPEMQAFRSDPRFARLAEGLGFLEYWRKFGPPEDCELRGTALRCS